MATVYVCRECGREYQSRSGLRRHMKSKHDVAGLPAIGVAVETAGGDEGTEVIEDGVAARVAASVVAAEQSEDPPASDRPACRAPSRGKVDWLPGGVVDKEAKTACRELGINEDDVMAYRVYHEPLKVVLIEGPVGFKRVWTGG